MSTEDRKAPGAVQELFAVEHELDVLLAREGISVPADRKAGIVAGYADLRRMTALLRTDRTAASEPANVYSLDVIVRSA